MVVELSALAAVVLTSHILPGIDLVLVLPAIVLGGIFYWNAKNRSMDTAALWGTLITGMWLASIGSGVVALVGYLGTRPDNPGE